MRFLVAGLGLIAAIVGGLAFGSSFFGFEALTAVAIIAAVLWVVAALGVAGGGWLSPQLASGAGVTGAALTIIWLVLGFVARSSSLGIYFVYTTLGALTFAVAAVLALRLPAASAAVSHPPVAPYRSMPTAPPPGQPGPARPRP